MRARRLAIILAVIAFVVPWVPRLVHSPRIRYNDYGAAAACVALSACLLGLAFVAACIGARGADRKTYWPNVVAVGMLWFLATMLMPSSG